MYASLLTGEYEYRGARCVQHHAEPDEPGRPAEGAQQHRAPRGPAAPFKMGQHKHVCTR